MAPAQAKAVEALMGGSAAATVVVSDVQLLGYGHNMRETENNKEFERPRLLTWAMERTLRMERCEDSYIEYGRCRGDNIYHYQFKMQFINQTEEPVKVNFAISLLGTKEEEQKLPITLVRPDTTYSSQPIMIAPNTLSEGTATQAQYFVIPPQPHP
ncbi:hypothetical protein CB1_000975002 [Camelus ferus]|nr:hypothetical protein CB1_000975002 [Camelus ferus]